MKIEEEFITNKTIEEYNIYFDGQEVFSVKHDLLNKKENTLFDNFNDTYNIIMLLKKVYDLGKKNIDIDFCIR